MASSYATQLGKEHSRHMEQQLQSPGVRFLVCWRDRKETTGLEKSELGRESGDEEVKRRWGQTKQGPVGLGKTLACILDVSHGGS